jgi:hypothetical protein
MRTSFPQHIDDPIGGVRCPLAAAIEDQQLMPDWRGFDNNWMEFAQPSSRATMTIKMNEQNEEVANPDSHITKSKTIAFGPLGNFAMDRLRTIAQTLKE